MGDAVMGVRELIDYGLLMLRSAAAAEDWNEANAILRGLVDQVASEEDVRELAVTLALLVGSTLVGASPVEDRLERLGLELAWMWSS